MDCTKSKKAFSQTGPQYLTSTDWTDIQHRRIIMASLVQGVYILERDRQKHRQRTRDALAPPWWESFGFALDDDDTLKDGSSIFGAIFKFKPSASQKNASSYCTFSELENAPQYVVAFRGTLLKRKSMVKDLRLDVRCMFHTLNQSNRFDTAFDAVQKLVQRDLSSVTKVWLAGHSLGSAVAMLVGKNMILGGYPPLETYLFNPPFPSLPIESVTTGRVRDTLRVASSLLKLVTALIARAISSEKNTMIASDHGMFHELSQSGWTPYLFVNKDDVICSGFIGYFGRRKVMKDIGAEAIEILSTQISRTSLLTRIITGTDTEPLHVLPSAIVVTSLLNGLIKAHGLEQWYHRDLRYDFKVYLVDEISKITS